MPLKSVYTKTSGKLAPTIAAALTLATGPIPSSYQLHSSSLVASFVGEKSRSKPNEMNSYLSNQRIRQYSTTTSLPEFKKVNFPRINFVDQGKIVCWHKKEGDKVSEKDLLCEIEVDQNIIKFEAPEEGFLAKILYPEKSENIQVGKLICVIVENESDIPAFSKFSDTVESSESNRRILDAVEPSEVYNRIFETPKSSECCRIKATPFARKIMKEKELDLNKIQGSGPDKEVLASDLLFEENNSNSSVRSTVERRVDLPLPKESISKQLSETKSRNSYYSLTSEITVDALEKVQTRLNSILKSSVNPKELSIKDFVVKAAAMACVKISETRKLFSENGTREKSADLTVTVTTENGFLTPVLHDVANMGIACINDVISDFSSRNLCGRIEPQGKNSVLSSNLFDNPDTSKILNYSPCNLKIGKKQKKLIPKDDGFRAISVLNVTLSLDTKIIDRTTGNTWMKIFKEYLEKPKTMLM